MNCLDDREFRDGHGVSDRSTMTLVTFEVNPLDVDQIIANVALDPPHFSMLMRPTVISKTRSLIVTSMIKGIMTIDTTIATNITTVTATATATTSQMTWPRRMRITTEARAGSRTVRGV